MNVLLIFVLRIASASSASTFVSEVIGDLGKAPSITVPVVGGHSGVTVRLPPVYTETLR